jgi:hypothetical protein
MDVAAPVRRPGNRVLYAQLRIADFELRANDLRLMFEGQSVNQSVSSHE